MNKENTNAAARLDEPLVRVTRARAKSLGISGGAALPPRAWQDPKRVLREKSKRAETDENRASSAVAAASFQHKRRAVLKDVTNGASKHQATGRDPSKRSSKLPRGISDEIPPCQEDPKAKLAEELSKIKVAESEEFNESTLPEVDQPLPYSRPDDVQEFTERSEKKEEEGMVCEKWASSTYPDVVDIDTNLKDPQACSLYASDIYNNIRITELERRPSCNYMEDLQRDISPNMRAILIDWLVEVSEEYHLVPDTLYLTVNLIDRFLSQNHIEKQRLQLLGVSCMLIASKYEEILAPRAEEFCFITDNTYSRGEVLRMESEILNLVHFHLSVPTTKTFLRRFIHAAQSSFEGSSVELEFLANYIAELSLVDYKCLKFLPSLVAASAVFLARWTISQPDHPWNSTLEHYTGYKASELKITVLAMEDMQVNDNGRPGNAIQEKYKQPKFKEVATLTSDQSVRSLFY